MFFFREGGAGGRGDLLSSFVNRSKVNSVQIKKDDI